MSAGLGRLGAAAENEARSRLDSLLRDSVRLRFLEDRTRSTVQELRAMGVPWSAIGAALGITRQAAFKRYGADTLDRL